MGHHDIQGPLPPGPPPGPQSESGSECAAGADVDAEWAEYVAWLDREAVAGREPGPIFEPDPVLEPDPGTQEPSLAWASYDPDLNPPHDPDLGPPRPVAAVPALFAEDGVADLMAPGPFLAALTEQAVTRLASLSDSELVGVLRASRRQVAREHYKQALAAAEFGRRRQATFDAALARGVPAGCAPGGFPGEELAAELVISRGEAGHLIDDGIDLTGRLPRTLDQMAAGLVDAGKAGWIALHTRGLDTADTAHADEVLAEAAPDLREEQLARKAAALEMKLNPDAVKARREQARRDAQRVEARREASGNASLAGRELDVADVLASKAYLDAIAARLRECGVPGTLDQLRALALTDLTQGRDPLDRIQPAPDPTGTGTGTGQPSRPDSRDQSAQTVSQPNSRDQSAEKASQPGTPDVSATVPALINLLVPAETLLGLSAAPAQAGPWGLLDRDETRAVVTTAASHPATRWCVTLTGADGTALAHGCASGSRPRLLDDLGPQPPPAQLAELLRRLNITFTLVTRGDCDHAAAEGRYAPSRKLRHLVRARTVTCDAPGCQSPAVSADLDHTIPWPAGPTDQCNLAPRCRVHHRAKQAPDWTVEQIAPGVTRWTMPSGRTHITTPTKYDVGRDKRAA